MVDLIDKWRPTMLLTAEHEAALLAVDAYAITCSGRVDPRKGDQGCPWQWQEITVTVTISGFGETLVNATPTWQASAAGPTILDAFERALQYAPSQLAECNARAQGRLHDVLPEFDPDGTRKRSRPPRHSGPKISAADLAKLLDL